MNARHLAAAAAALTLLVSSGAVASAGEGRDPYPPKPTTAPTSQPTSQPTTAPVTEPTTEPTTVPTTSEPTTAPTTEPTTTPTSEPATTPTTEPSTTPTSGPTEPETTTVEVTEPVMWETCNEAGVVDSGSDLWEWTFVSQGEDEHGPYFEVEAVATVEDVTLTGQTLWRLYYSTPEDLGCDVWIDAGEIDFGDDPEPSASPSTTPLTPQATSTTRTLASTGAGEWNGRAVAAIALVAVGGGIVLWSRKRAGR